MMDLPRMRTGLSSLIAAGLLWSCAVQKPAANAAAASAGNGEIECIERDKIMSSQRETSDLLAFYLTGGEAYANRLPETCPALEQLEGTRVVAIGGDGPRICRNDSVRIFDPAGPEAAPPGPSAKCRLGGFIPTPIVRVVW